MSPVEECEDCGCELTYIEVEREKGLCSECDDSCYCSECMASAHQFRANDGSYFTTEDLQMISFYLESIPVSYEDHILELYELIRKVKQEHEYLTRISQSTD